MEYTLALCSFSSFKMNRMLEKFGKKRVNYKKRESSFKIKAMGLTGRPVTDFQKEDVHGALDELVKIWNKEDSLTVVLTISASKGITVKDKKGNELLWYKIYNVANCTVDESHPEVFLFVARQRDSTTNCHAFYCSDHLQAEAISLSMSNAFHKAFEAWMERNGTVSGNIDGIDQYDEQNDDVFASGEATGSGLPDRGEKENNVLECCAPSKRDSENGRRPSTMSEASIFSFGSQADEVFGALVSVAEEKVDWESRARASLPQRSNFDWENLEW